MAGQQLVKAFIQIIGGVRAGLPIPVLFNPSEYSINRANVYKATSVPGLGSPLIQFINGDAATLTMDLLIDDYTDGLNMPEPTGAPPGPPMPAAVRIEIIAGLLDIDPDLHAPPPVRFVWGSLRFDAVLEKVDRKVTLFHPSGIPARATLSVSFKEFRPLAQQMDRPRRQSADKTKRRRIGASETIWSIADREYGDVRGWRQIARESDVDDPRALRPGDWVKVPPLENRNALVRPR
jgi:hypothetical protein